MITYRELVPELPSEYETLKQNVHRFATESRNRLVYKRESGGVED